MPYALLTQIWAASQETELVAEANLGSENLALSFEVLNASGSVDVS